jgi:ornithine cyclodeaminase/alanine dehydrogenase-like protein (mu-crystallin family)
MPEIQIDKKSFLYVSEEDLKKVGLTTGEAIKIVEKVFKDYRKPNVIVPEKMHLNLGTEREEESSTIYMPAYLGPLNIAGMKWVGMNFSNPEKYGIQSINALLILMDPKTATIASIISGNLLTAIRTGAATAVAAKYLAKRDSERVCIIGAGVQGRFQLSSLAEVFEIEEVRISDFRKEAMNAYSQEMSRELGLSINPIGNVKEAVKDVDIIVTATTSKKPIVRSGWVKRGCFIAAIGTYPEIESKLVMSVDKIIVDKTKAALSSGALSGAAKEGMISADSIYSELGDIVAGNKKGRESEKEIILCALRGIASEDVALGYRVYQLALKKGIGRILPI